MERFRDHEGRGQRCVLAAFGDHDPGGLLITDKLRTNLDDLSRAVGWSPDRLIIDRFGLNYAFIQRHRLTWIDNLETSSGERLDDPNHAHHKQAYVQDYIKRFGARKCEGNALVVRPDAGRRLCRQAIEKYVDANAPAQYREWLEGRREEARRALPAALRRAIRSQGSQ
jgi:hypothetical protein